MILYVYSIHIAMNIDSFKNFGFTQHTVSLLNSKQSNLQFSKFIKKI